MAYDSHDATESILERLEREISGVYKQAADDMTKTVNDFFESYVDKNNAQLEAMMEGKITSQQYSSWAINTMARGQGYVEMRDKLAERYTNANEVAMSYVNDWTPGIYSLNRNYTAYTIEQAGANVDFHLWNEEAVRRNIIDHPNLMPNYPEWKAVQRGIDLAYGRQQITANITSGILQGLSPYQIADRLQKSMENMNRTSAIRTARTAFTAAENAGTQDAFEEAADMGVNLDKEWVATEDDRTREEHDLADGQIVPYDEPFEVGGEELMYPGDDSLGASGWNIYNCRCTMIARVEGVDMSDAEKWAKESFDDWEDEKEEVGDTIDDWLADTEAEEMLNSIKAGEYDDSWMEEYEETEAFEEAKTVEFMDVSTSDKIDEVFGGSVRDWLDEMTDEEQDGVVTYTGPYYRQINSYLRGRSEGSEWTVKKVDEITSAISKFELEEDIVVYRRMSNNVWNQLEEGEIFRDKAFMSSSVNPSEDMSLFGHNIMEIHVEKGRGIGAYVDDISSNQGELEFLFQRDSGFYLETKNDTTKYAVAHFVKPE